MKFLHKLFYPSDTSQLPTKYYTATVMQMAGRTIAVMVTIMCVTQYTQYYCDTAERSINSLVCCFARGTTALLIFDCRLLWRSGPSA